MILPVFASLLFFAFAPIFIPHIHFLAFAPVIVIALAKRSIVQALWIAFAAGFLIDLLSPGSFMGSSVFAHVGACALLIRFRRNMMIEKAIGISAFTALFSLLATAIALPFAKIPLTLIGIGSDLLAMPILDGIYAFCWFHCPVLLYNQLIRVPKIEKWVRKYKIWKRG